MAKKTRVRDAGTGRIVPPEEAAKRPKETVVENAGKASLEKRVTLLEQVIAEAGGPLSNILRRLSE